MFVYLESLSSPAAHYAAVIIRVEAVDTTVVVMYFRPAVA